MTGSTADEPRARILVVDDDQVARLVVAQALEQEGYHVDHAVDGADALEQLNRSRPDLVLLDMTMPRLSGLEVLHAIRQRFGSMDLPVVMISARSEAEDVLGALHLGANDVVTKPMDFGLLVRRVRSVVSHRRAVFDAMVCRARLEAVVAATRLPVSLHDGEGRFIDASAALCRLLQREEDELLGTPLHALFHPEDAHGLTATDRTLPDRYRLLARIQRLERYGWCEIEQVAFRDGVTGDVLAVQAVWTDRDARLPMQTNQPIAATTTERRSFAFTPPPVQERLNASARLYGPPIAVDSTPIPRPRTGDETPLVVPGIPDADAQIWARLTLDSLPPR